MIPSAVLRAARRGFGLPHGSVRLLSTRFGKVCLAHRSHHTSLTQLRLVREHAGTATRLHAEMVWLRHLHARHGLSVPAPFGWRDGALVSPTLLDDDGTAWRAIRCRWVPGAHLDRGLRARHFAAAGSLLASMHDANRDAPAGVTAARPEWWIPRLYELATTLRDVVHDVAPPPPGVSAALVTGLRETSTALARAFDTLARGSAHAGLIHTDSHWRNMRFTTARIGIVDFEDFATGRFMLDIACLWGKVENRHGSARMLDAILSGYDAVRTLPPAHRRDLQVMLAFRRLDYAGWVLSWPRIDHQPWGPAFLAGTPQYIESMLSR
ncbi:MAG TPA: phosphotransferase [Gemmatimonadaceae bacterium]|nr:phosphotransferase [Gemmatimonadaceae bacterium]